MLESHDSTLGVSELSVSLGFAYVGVFETQVEVEPEAESADCGAGINDLISTVSAQTHQTVLLSVKAWQAVQNELKCKACSGS